MVVATSPFGVHVRELHRHSKTAATHPALFAAPTPYVHRKWLVCAALDGNVCRQSPRWTNRWRTGPRAGSGAVCGTTPASPLASPCAPQLAANLSTVSRQSRVEFVDRWLCGRSLERAKSTVALLTEDGAMLGRRRVPHWSPSTWRSPIQRCPKTSALPSTAVKKPPREEGGRRSCRARKPPRGDDGTPASKVSATVLHSDSLQGTGTTDERGVLLALVRPIAYTWASWSKGACMDS